jgi:hypothetical protein
MEGFLTIIPAKDNGKSIYVQLNNSEQACQFFLPSLPPKMDRERTPRNVENLPPEPRELALALGRNIRSNR